MAKEARLAARMEAIQPFHVMALLARARELESQGRDIVHMEIGEPDFPTPEPIVRAGIEALQAGHHHYTPAQGLPALRQAISADYATRYGIEIDPGRILITPGSSGALQLLMSVLINPGDQVLMADPGYPCNRNFVRLVDGDVGAIAVTGSSNYQLTIDHLQTHWNDNTRAVLLASPANPTGALIAAEEMKVISDFVTQRGGHLLVDEIYHGLVYDTRAQTALALSNDVFVINSFSKFFGMTGWRLGWLVAPQQYVDAFDKVAQNIFLAASTPAQHAALAAFHPATMKLLEQRRQTFQARRDYLLPALESLGFKFDSVAQGAFYLYADCSQHTEDSAAFCRALLEEGGVATTPGKDFGDYRSNRRIRFAYTTSLSRLKEGVKRISGFLQTRQH